MHPRSIGPGRWPLAGLMCAAAFLLIAVAVQGRGSLALDDPVVAAIQGLPLPVAFWTACTTLGGLDLVLLGTLLVLAVLISGRIRLAIILASILIGATLFSDQVKEIVARPRPPGGPLAGADNSFPSHHALFSTVAFGLLALVVWRSRLPRAARLAAVAVAIALPLLVGLSRVALADHYPSDVFAGWLAGLAFVALGAWLIGVTGAMERDRWPHPATGPPE
jgi:membrane-associated phospholipid phosphatase